MVQGPSNETKARSSRSLAIEIGAVFTVQIALVIALVKVADQFLVGGNLHALVGVVFVLLPMLVLDRTDRPYARYGISWGRPLYDLLFALALMVVIFPPFAAIAPHVWGIAERTWHFTWPSGYPAVALSHLLVVALPEEFFYRGYLMGRLDDILPSRLRLLGASVGPGLLIQAVLFALGHYLVDFQPTRLAVFFPALAFGWLKYKRGTIVAPIVFHAGSNIFMEILRAGYGLG